MADRTGIEWTDATWNPIRGCTRVSEGCRNCYAETIAARFSDPGQPYHGLAERGRPGSKWTGKVQLIESALTLPLHWKKPRRIFVNSMSDLFHESVPDEWIDRIFAVMAVAPHHTYQVLTKRPERMHEYMTKSLQGPWADMADWPLPNVWLGTSVENQPTADERIPLLLATPAAKRFISAEPLLGQIDLSWVPAPDEGLIQPLIANGWPRIDWVIAGGESGPHARPMHPDWPRTLRDQCAAACVPFFFKQWGEWLPGTWSDEETDGALFYPASGGPSPKLSPQSAWADRVHWFDAEIAPCGPGAIRIGKKSAGALLDGIEHKAFPA